MFGFIKDILRRKGIANAALRSKERKIEVHNFESAKTIAVVISDFAEIERLRSFLKNLARKYSVKMTVLIYFPQDRLPEGIIQDEYNILFANSECSRFTGKPRAAMLDKFMNNEFNILIDLSLKQYFPLRYIITASKANFKLGSISENVNLYDFTLSGNNNEEDFIKNLEVYLKKFKLQ